MKKKERQKNHPKLPNSDNLLKQAQEKLQESEERYKSLFDRSLDLVYLHDFQGRFLDANDAALKRLGYTKEEIHSLNFASFLSEDQIPIAIKSTEILLAGIQKGLTEYRLKHKDGSDVYVETRGSIVMSRGKPVAIQAIARDITDRKKAEEALRQREEELSIKSRNLEEMNAALKVLLKQREDDRYQMEENVLTNVKTSIIPYLEKLKKGALSKQQKTYIKMIEDQISEIIAPFLRSLSRSSFDLTPQELRVADMVKNGHTTKDIADVLKISTKTVDYHRDNLRRKLGIRNQKTNLRSFLLRFT
ncbi:MAG: PAS domain S-box protein [Smithella sp.]|nr:PAS domain S-box protein [Smithella sp.]